MSKIAVIVGSLRRESINRKLAEALAKLAGPKAEFTFLKIDDLPLFNQDLEANPPAAVTRVKGQIEAADGVLIVTPEYNRSIPGVLKNAIDWASRPYGKNSFSGKPTAGRSMSYASRRSAPVAGHTACTSPWFGDGGPPGNPPPPLFFSSSSSFLMTTCGQLQIGLG